MADDEGRDEVVRSLETVEATGNSPSLPAEYECLFSSAGSTGRMSS